IYNNPDANFDKVQKLAEYYINECNRETINSDIAFVQMCLETGFLRFGGLVTEDMNNFCGLGAIDSANTGNRFESEKIGVRAHVQHLKGYGTTAPITANLVDPRYKWINPKGKAPDIFGLSGTWAADPLYGKKLYILLERLANY
ncbi:MAG TPA: glucosaminidase domain-containing protein, partial [Treponemataceae bacterium]|nr:glucosaminidase domain-containing protein [Treponemataceae bacterium]